MSNRVSLLEHIAPKNADVLDDDVLGELIMDFFLRYQGPLPTCSRTDSRAPEKDFIRRKLSPQLKDLWENHPGLKKNISIASARELAVKGRSLVDKDNGNEPTREHFGHVAIKGWKFVPLIVRARRWICEIKITFLRRHDPGDIVRGGDIDNRLKTLFDGLRIPYESNEIAHSLNDQAEPDCFCLLEDDALISSVAIETERLWGPIEGEERESDVNILMRVTIKKYNKWLDMI